MRLRKPEDLLGMGAQPFRVVALLVTCRKTFNYTTQSLGGRPAMRRVYLQIPFLYRSATFPPKPSEI